MTLSIELRGVTFGYRGSPQILSKVDLAVPKGSVYGFLGPNGAGKTTTLRLILGLLTADAGHIALFERGVKRPADRPWARIGSMIETPSLYSHLSAKDNLRVWQPLYGVPNDRLDEVLVLVGLAAVGRRPVHAFSLGMKQRLGIAVALLHAPPLLVLDEPTNGLDPHGVIEIRDLLIHLNRETGTTILVSSHMLTEVERLATHVGVLSRGQMVFEGSLGELRTRQDADGLIRVVTSNTARALELLQKYSSRAHLLDGAILVPGISPGGTAAITRSLVLAGIDVLEVTRLGTDLESLFLDLVA